MSALAWILLGLLSVLWGGSFFFVGVAVAEVPPLTIVAIRRGDAVIANPPPDTIIEPHDEFLVVGNMEDAERLSD